MPKYVTTIVRKSSLIPWVLGNVLKENSEFLTQTEKQLYEDAKAESAIFPGYLGFQTTRIGNTQIDTFEFDTLENLNDWVNKTRKVDSPLYQPELKTSLCFRMIGEKVKQLGLESSYTVSTSIETT